MIKFNIEKHVVIQEGDQVVSFNEYLFVNADNFSNEQIIETLLNSEPDLFYTLLDHEKKIKRAPMPSYIFLPIITPPRITMEEYISLNKRETYDALVNFSSDPYWRDDQNDFNKLVICFFELTQNVTTNCFYAGKELFSHEKPEWKTSFETFIYEFKIIYLDRNEGKLGISIWSYD